MDFLKCEKRFNNLDIAKGILIITVVISHSNSFLAQYMYWFHMPAFFFISGMLFKERFNIKDQFVKFFIPYILFSLVDICFDFLAYPQDASPNNFLLYFWRHIYSGKAIGGVFWFIPVLFFSKFIFNFLKTKFKDVYVVIFLILLYCIAHMYSIKVIPENIVDINTSYYTLWNFDVLALAIPYYGLGYYCRNLVPILNSKLSLLISLIASLIYIKFNFSEGYYYYLNMKFSYYKFPVLDLVVPLLFTALILSLSYAIQNYSNFLRYLGKNSLIIMYLHNPLNKLIASKISINSLAFVLIGVLVPILINRFLIENNSILTFMFKGQITSTPSPKLAFHP